MDWWPEHGTHARQLEKMQSHIQQVATVDIALTSGTVLAEDSLVAALLHDIGYWILAMQFPDELHKAVAHR